MFFVCVATISGTLLWASVAKVRSTHEVAEGIRTALGVSPRLARAAAVALPLVELAIATAMWISPLRRIALLSFVLLMAVFAWYVLHLAREHPSASCACFGVESSRPASYSSVARNGMLVALGAVALATSDYDSEAYADGVLFAIAPSIVAIVLVASFDDLWALTRRRG